MTLGGREGLSLRSLWNDRKELASKQLREKQPNGSSFLPKLPSTQAPVQEYFKGKQVQDSEAPPVLWRLSELGETGQRTLQWGRIQIAPCLSASVPAGFLWPGAEV